MKMKWLSLISGIGMIVCGWYFSGRAQTIAEMDLAEQITKRLETYTNIGRLLLVIGVIFVMISFFLDSTKKKDQ